MMRAFFSGIVLSVVMASGCANVPDDDMAEDLEAETDAELRSQPTDPASRPARGATSTPRPRAGRASCAISIPR
jgi:hypothetical protein